MTKKIKEPTNTIIRLLILVFQGPVDMVPLWCLRQINSSSSTETPKVQVSEEIDITSSLKEIQSCNRQTSGGSWFYWHTFLTLTETFCFCFWKRPSNSILCSLLCRNLPAILDWVKTQKPGAMGVNIITSDFVDLVDFATTVIELNDLLQEDRALAKCWFNFSFNLMLNLLIQARVLKDFLLGWPLGCDAKISKRRAFFSLLTGPFG